MNLVLALLLLGASSVSVWAGLTDPEGGTLAGLRNVVTGQGNSKHQSATSAAFMSSLAPLLSSVGAGGTAAVGYSEAGATGTRAAIVAETQTWLGVPYKWGGNTRAGVDCSGLVQQVYRKHGIELPRVSAMQAGQGRRVAQGQPGDLVAFGAPVHHIGIVIGGGNMIHSPRPGRVVRVESIAGCAQSMRESHTVQYRDVLGGGRDA